MTHEQLLNLLSLGVKKGASDIHLEAGYPPSYRIHGELFAAKLEKLTPADTEWIARDILPLEEGFLTGKVCDIDRGFSVAGLSRFRVSALRQRGSFGLVLRVIPFDVPDLASLHLPDVLESVADIREGLVLVTGATGNGKSTTIASMIQAINRKERLHVLTIEDPIEYVFSPDRSLIVQREVGLDTGDFHDGMRAALRQDPDVIMLGEMRDKLTADAALKAGETGHLVVSSLHTNDTQRTISRFVGLFSPEEQQQVRYRLAENLKAVVSLRLLPRADGTALVPAVEVMLMTRSIQECVRDPTKLDQLLSLVEKGHDDMGMQSFDQHLLELARAGVISREVARLNATRPADLTRDLMLEGGA
jgi:twitching motility protein PilT